MINFQKRTLANGLKVIVHQDNSSPISAFNLLYDVGAKDEDPERTGFAHLFEHLMFEGSVNIAEFDKPLQQAGGENNAFTSNDITNYYITMQADNIETAFWLESDRMLGLDFSEEKLRIQKGVVIEEYRQRYLNRPYGDVWLLMRPLVYKVHPYQWPTIGKDISHIENATLDDVRNFFYKHYAPNNAILTVAGNHEPEEIFELAEKWFGPIEKRDIQTRNLPKEPVQTEKRELHVERQVPYDSIHIAFHMCRRNHPDFKVYDLLSDVLSNGDSARLFQNLVKEKQLFTDIDAYLTGDYEDGAFVIKGTLIEGITFDEAYNAIWDEISEIQNQKVSEYELQKVKNKIESTKVFSQMTNLNKAMNLCGHELMGNANSLNTELDEYLSITDTDIQRIAKQALVETNCSVLYYHAKK